MARPPVSFVPATQELAHAFNGRPPPYTFKGYVGLLEGEPVAIGGICFIDRMPFLFSDLKPAILERPRDVARGVRLLEGQCKAYKGPVYAVPDGQFGTSEALLGKLGFVASGAVSAIGPILVRGMG